MSCRSTRLFNDGETDVGDSSRRTMPVLALMWVAAL